MGTVQAAIYDAVAATEGGLEPFMASVQAPAGASTDAAVATAAHDVLVARVPLQAVPITTEYDTFMGTIADGQAKTDGRQVGAAVAEEILLLRADDGLGNVVPYVQPTPGRVREILVSPPDPPVPAAVLEAIAQADVVSLGPGSWYTSVLPHLLVPLLRAALAAAQARVVVVLNLEPQPGETDGFSPEEHLKVRTRSRANACKRIPEERPCSFPTASRSSLSPKQETRKSGI